ncbi:alcohol dehydrogenase catalytic domain-containing protein [Paenibacillus sp. TC-CSREp1]|uniref:alcohol dehydrogenase catalytic domain-containing protein n=1 Tax=Paenibacillus sp. TC-CSREp1 TaxID=3410089 RepID=UPI003CF72173
MKFILGVEIAGTVLASGEKVARVTSGDRDIVVSQTAGVYAEYVAAEEYDLAEIPQYLSDAESALIPAAGMTAWQALSPGNAPWTDAKFVNCANRQYLRR